MRYRRVVVAVIALLAVGLGSAWAQIAVTDPSTTSRNAVIAVLRNQIVDVVRAQQEKLVGMARRLSATTNLDKYAAPDAPTWSVEVDAQRLEFAESYRAALRYGDADGAAYNHVARNRQDPAEALTYLGGAAREAVTRGLATLDATDSAIIVGTHQAGLLRSHGRHEIAALDALERDVTDPSEDQSTTAVLDKISAAGLLETRQKQARLQYLTSLAEQLVLDNKRARDTEAALLNMQLRRLLHDDGGEGGGGMLDGAGDDLRTWRQP
jgi:hypothetical protein